MKKKKTLLSPPSNVQLVSNLLRSTKALLWKGAGMIIFSWINAQNIFFTYLIYKIILFGG